MPEKLDSQAARTDLTDRECAKLIGGTVGVLMEMADPDVVRRGLRWWANLTDAQWTEFCAAGRSVVAALTGPRSG